MFQVRIWLLRHFIGLQLQMIVKTGSKHRAISTVLSGGLIAAILGPSIVEISLSLNNSVPFLYSYLAIVILNCLGPFILSYVKPIPLSKSSGGKYNDNSNKTNLNRPLVTIFKSPVIFVSIICSMIAYGVMNLIMTSSPIAIVGWVWNKQAANVVSAMRWQCLLPPS